MCTGILMSPGIDKPPRLVVNYHVILRFIGKQDDAAEFILYHFMAILYRVLRGIELAPLRVNAIAFIVVAENGFIGG